MSETAETAQPVETAHPVETAQPTETTNPLPPTAVPADETSNEPAAPDASGALVSVSATVYTAVSFIMLVFVVVGTSVSWFVLRDTSASKWVSLWDISTETSGGVVNVLNVADVTCGKYREYMRAAEAFSIITIFIAAAAFLFGLFSRVRNASVKTGGALLAVAFFVSSIITWGVAVRTFYLSFCGVDSMDKQNYTVHAGVALFVSAWVLSVVNLIVALKDVQVPKVLPQVVVHRVVSMLFTIFAASAFAFTVIGTPISVFSYWSNPTTEVRITIWNTHTYSGGQQVAKEGSAAAVSGCGDMPKYFHFSQAFAIISIAACLIATIAGGAAASGSAGKKAPLITGFFAALVTLIKFSADLALYYKRFCGARDTLDGQLAQMNAGFALFVTASIALLFGVILLAVAALVQLLAKSSSDGAPRWSTFLFISATVISLIFMTIGLTQPVAIKSAGNDYVRINWWNVEERVGTSLWIRDFTCKATWERLRGGGALGVIAIGFTLVSAFLGIGQLTSGSLRKGAAAVSLLATLPQLTAWALAVAVYWGDFCGFKPYKDYKISSGLGLFVSAWTIQLTAAVINFVVGE